VRVKWAVAIILVPLMLSQGLALAQESPPPPQVNPSPSPTVKVSPPPAPKPTPAQSSAQVSAVENSDSVQMELVNCAWWGDCLLAKTLLPTSMQVNTYQLWFENDSSATVGIAKTALVAKGQRTGYQLTAQDVVLNAQDRNLPSSQVTGLNLQVNRLGIPPDQYNGKLYLMLKDNKERLSLPLMINVRTGPMLPILALFFGVVLGRLLKYMEERGGPQSERLKSINRLEADLNALHPEDQKILANMLLSVRQLVFREELEKADVQTSLIRGRLEVLQKLRRIQERLEADEMGNLQQFLPRVEQVRVFLSEEEDESAKQELKTLQEDLSGMKGDARGADLEAAVSKAVKRLDTKDAAGIPKEELQRSNLRKTLIWLSGISDELRAEATLWVVRPMLSLGLLVGLALMGINELYVEKGASLGAKPLTDYWGLVLWGLSADVASRSLSSLKEKQGA
jgi:hypothetical protein